MSLKAKVEAIIYATEEPVTLNELAALLKDAALADLRATEEARLALNETVSDGSPVPEADEALEFAAALEDAAAEFANEASMTAEAAVADPVQLDKSASAPTKKEQKQTEEREQLKAVKARVNAIIDDLTADYASSDRGMEIRQIAGGYRMATKPEHHDVVVSFAKSLKPPVRLSLQALETLSVIAYKQPVT
ncbi:MAG: SMC-Scp complex subunit ScpB, partial [Candidatus Korobacteraceae bacterium]